MKIEIHNTTYIFLLIAFLSGYFEYMFLLLIIIIVHEYGHALFARIINFKFDKIVIYPFGGITKYNEDLNISTNKELFVLVGGIYFQILFLIFIMILYKYGIITTHVFNIIKKINILLISFNFLPILPLDGGRLLNIILDKIFPYKLSNIISIIISIIILVIFYIYNKTILSYILIIFLIKCIVIEINNIKYKYNRFIVERYLNEYSFKKIKKIKNINKLKRDNYHIINNMLEKRYLHNMFDRIKWMC